MQSKCPYCTREFNNSDNVYGFYHEDPVSFHAIHVACLNGVKKGVLQAIRGETRDKCPSCNQESLYVGEGTYEELKNFANLHSLQNGDVMVSASAASSDHKLGSEQNPFEIDGGRSKKLKKRKVVKTKKNKFRRTHLKKNKSKRKRSKKY